MIKVLKKKFNKFFQPSNKNEFKFATFIKIYWPIFLFLAILVFIAYFNSLRGDFVGDDRGLIIEGNYLSTLQFFFTDALSSFRMIVLAFIYQTCQLNASCYHLANIFFHLGSTFLIFTIIYLLLDFEKAFLTSSVFAVHPLLSESVSWITGGVYAQYSFFFLLSLLFYILNRIKFRGLSKFYYLSLVFYFLALLTTKWATPLFLIFYSYEFIFNNFKKNWKSLIPFTCLGFTWGLWYFFQIPARVTQIEPGNNPLLLYNPFYHWAEILSVYLKLTFYPFQQTFSHQFSLNNINAEMVFLFGTVFLTIYSFFKNRVVFFWLTFFMISIIPILIPFQTSTVIAERYVYLGSIGLFVGVIVTVSHFFKLKRKGYLLFLFFSLVGLLSYLTILRNRDWQNEKTLALATLRVNPNDTSTQNLLGDLYARDDNYKQAAVMYLKTLERNPTNLEATSKLAIAYQEMGEYSQAITYNLLQLKIQPNSLPARHRLSEIYFKQENYNKVIEFTTQELELQPQNSTLYLNLGKAYYLQSQKEKARENLKKSLEINPDNQSAQKLLKELN